MTNSHSYRCLHRRKSRAVCLFALLLAVVSLLLALCAWTGGTERWLRKNGNISTDSSRSSRSSSATTGTPPLAATVQLKSKDDGGNQARGINSRDRNHNRHPTIVLLPGPHKTGTTSVQAALYHWMNPRVPPGPSRNATGAGGVNNSNGNGNGNGSSTSTSTNSSTMVLVPTVDAFDQWAYPIPTQEDYQSPLGRQTRQRRAVGGGKGYAPMVTRLFGATGSAAMAVDDPKSTTSSSSSSSPNTDMDPEADAAYLIQHSPLLQLYVQTLQTAWDQGKNIVIASEHLDRLAVEEVESSRRPLAGLVGGGSGSGSGNRPTSSSRGVTPDQLWARLRHCLPFTSSSSSPPQTIVVGIQHRTPRIDHLISMWHQLSQRQETLLDFITKPAKPGLASFAHSLNSLGLADFFVQRGYSVVVVDTGGVVADGRVDLPVVMACHVLQVPCSRQEGPSSNKDSSSSSPSNSSNLPHSGLKRLNQRADPAARGVDEETLQAIQEMLEEYDCQFRHYSSQSDHQVRMVYGEHTFRDCSSLSSTGSSIRIPFSQTIQRIIHLVCGRYPEAKHCRAGTK